jgi:ABC-type Na+ efflux pump permease subunit
MSHHSCSNGSILKVATGVVLGIWAAKIIPILIIAAIGLAIWLIYLLLQEAARFLNGCGDALTLLNRWLARRFSRRTAQVFWVVLLTVVMGGILLAAATAPAPIR